MAPVDHFDVTIDDLFTKHQRAAKRASGLAKDRAAFRARSDAKKTLSHSDKSHSLVAPKEPSFPHRAARVAARNIMAKGRVELAADLPTISIGLLGSHKKRWSRKARVSGMLQQSLTTREGSFDSFPTLQAFRNVREPDEIQGFAPSDCSQRLTLGQPVPEAVNCFDISDQLIAVDDAEARTESSIAGLMEDLEDAAAFPDLPSQTASLESITKVEENGFKSGDQEGWVVVSSQSFGDAVVKAGYRRSSRRASSRKRMGQTAAVAPSEDVGVDWSFAGIPREMCKRLIQGSTNSAHLSMHAKKESSSALPLSALRAQSKDQRRRQDNTACRSRSASKPRDCKQTRRRL